MGRPKNEITRLKQLNIRLTNFEYEKISRVAKKKNCQKPMQFCAELICLNSTSQKNMQTSKNFKENVAKN